MKSYPILCSLLLAGAVFNGGLLGVSSLAAPVPRTLHYQGRISVNGQAFSGVGKFKFALVGPGESSGTTKSHWSNDGSSTDGSAPKEGLAISVVRGLYSATLGETLPIQPSALEHENVALRVWFAADGDTFKLVTPDQPLSAVSYALIAAEAQTVSPGAIGSEQIANGAIGSAQIAGGAIGTSHIANGAVTAGKIGTGAVGDAQLLDGCGR